MKILLVKVPSNMHVVLPPLGLGYVASYLKKKFDDIEVKILDCLKEGYNFNDFKNYIVKEKPDVVGTTAFTMEIDAALKCSKIAKDVDKNIMTIIGGPHASNAPEDILKNDNVDFIIRSEAEMPFYKLIKELKGEKNFKDVPNLGYKKDDEIILNEIEFLEDLDELPYPDYELMRFHEYPKMYFMKKHPSAPIVTSRGCPFQCTFCSAGKLSGKKFRFRSAENIMEEIKWLKSKYNIKEFQIWDDNFTVKRDRAIKFCNMLIEENMNLEWWCPNGLRIETLDEELLKKMKQSGCYAMAVGIESGSEKIQKDMKKFLDLDKAREIINLAKKIGIRTQGFFILGYPTETKEDVLKTIKFAKELPLDRASFSLFQPLVGSEIYENLKKEGRLDKINLSNCEYSKTSVLPKGITAKELKNLQRRAIIEFYFRPKVFIKFTKENLSFSQIKEIFLMIKKYLIGK